MKAWRKRGLETMLPADRCRVLSLVAQLSHKHATRLIQSTRISSSPPRDLESKLSFPGHPSPFPAASKAHHT